MNDDDDDLLKSLTWLELSRRQCPNVPYILRTNDRAVIDLIALQNQLSDFPDPIKSEILCKKKTPSFLGDASACDGGTYLMSNGTCDRLFNGFKSRQRWDLSSSGHFVMGILAPSANVSILDWDWNGLEIVLELDFESGKRNLLSSTIRQSDEREIRFWEAMKSKHHIEPVALAFDPEFATTTYENYTIRNAEFCRDRWPDLEILVVIHSKPSQADYRDYIRITWADPRIYSEVKIRPLFFIGRSPSPLLEAQIRRESDIHGDLVQTDFLDSYTNLTYKANFQINQTDINDI